jgi:hypothetical protein
MRIFLQEWSCIELPGDPRDKRVTRQEVNTSRKSQITTEADEDYTKTTAGKMGLNLEEHSITVPIGHSALGVVSHSA